MVNFNKLKALINEQEKKKEIEKREFFLSLKLLAESELRLKQINLNSYLEGQKC